MYEHSITLAQDLGLKLPTDLTDALGVRDALAVQLNRGPDPEALNKLKTTATARTAPSLLAEHARALAEHESLQRNYREINYAIEERIVTAYSKVAVSLSDEYLTTKANAFTEANDAARKVPGPLALNLGNIARYRPDQAADAVRLVGATNTLSKLSADVDKLTETRPLGGASEWAGIVATLAAWTTFSGDWRDGWLLAQKLRTDEFTSGVSRALDNVHGVFSAYGATVLASEGLAYVGRPLAERAALGAAIVEDGQRWTYATGGQDLILAGSTEAEKLEAINRASFAD